MFNIQELHQKLFLIQVNMQKNLNEKTSCEELQ